MEIISAQDFEQLFREKYSRLYRFALHTTHDSEASKDIVSETFTALWKRRQLLGTNRIEGYLFTSVYHQCLKWIEKDNRRGSIGQMSLPNLSDEDLADIIIREERIVEIEAVIREMPERTRYVLEQCYYNHRTYRDVADGLGISSEGVKKHMMKALSMLREHFHVKKSKNQAPKYFF